jgi:predicted nucleic acid-binding protein
LIVGVDTSAFARALAGKTDAAAGAVVEALRADMARLPPTVVTELLSNPDLPNPHHRLIISIPMLDIIDGFWVRAGLLRAELKGRGLKANVADCLIAQACIDHGIPLISYDRDFRHFRSAGLILA